MINQTPLEIYRATDSVVNGTVKLNGTVVNLTGSSLSFKAKWNTEDADVDAVVSLSSPASGITIVSAAAGTITITIPDTATSSIPNTDFELQYSLKLTDASGNIRVLASGPLRVKAAA